ncbi:tetratricopeptide repeat protein [Desertibaculum subflavum]|uniref:tetratricopeptide repeat protein n=1 Tax=Desertibaculum subflavum TaxID=2268458 RepID=UPI0034D3071D
MSVAAEPIPGGGLRLRFPWKEPVAAAVYERGSRLWIVFSAPALLDLTGLGAGDLVTEARQVPQADAAVLTLRLRQRLMPVVDMRDNAWIVDLKDPRDAPRPAALAAVAEPHHPNGPRVIVGTAAAAPPLRLRDPEIGDEVDVVPIGRAPIGMSIPREYPQFELLPTVQGIVVQPKADGVAVEVTPEAVAIRADRGLQITGANQAKGVAPAGEGGVAPIKADPMKFRAWAGAPGAYVPTRQALQQALAKVPRAKIGEARLELARFHLANGEEAEALGVLATAGAADSRLADEPQFRLLRAAALIEMGRHAAAEAELVRPSLAADPEAMLWRGLAAEGLGDHAKAAQLLRRGENVLVHYPPELQGTFRLAIVDAHLGQGNLASAKAALELIDPARLNARQKIELLWRQAQADLKSGDRLGARPKLEQVAASAHRPLAARARFTLIEEQLAAGQIERDKAIQGMDGLRLAWRGDDFEPGLLRRIGSLMVDGGKWRDGFAAWREAAALFAKTPQAKQITDELAAGFERLFLGGAADKLSPVEALGIYYDFRELTPTGAKGDEMIRRLADRLAAVDLLRQAADLIEHQVNFRLKGEERARLATRLAILRLLERQPEKALKALESTAGQPLPPEQTLERKLVEARALGDLGRYEQARKALAEETAPAANEVRVELAWRAKDWAEAARLAGAAAEARLQAQPKGDADLRRQVLKWATALTLLGDEPALAGLRGRFTPIFEGTKEAQTFLVLTSRVDRTDKDYQALTKEIAGVAQVEGFLAAYRERIKAGQLSAIN